MLMNRFLIAAAKRVIRRLLKIVPQQRIFVKIDKVTIVVLNVERMPTTAAESPDAARKNLFSQGRLKK